MSVGNENNEACFHYESERFKSFARWPINSPVDRARLAKAGFYYSDLCKETVCFSCHGHVNNWNYGDIVLKKHAELFPHCDFINNRSNNVPADNCALRDEGKTKSNPNEICTYSEKKKLSHANLFSESERLKTFIGKWPVPYISAADAAHAGFFYLGSGDKVQCTYCKIILSGWESGDDPLEEHVKHSPQCKYISDLKQPEVKKVDSWYEQNSQDVCGNMHKTSECKLTDFHKSLKNSNMKNLGIHLHKGPTYPQQSSLSARLRSFSSWPINSAVSKELLAEAGFFYIGLNDRTKCFHCNGGLCSWEYGDDPWVEHARWFPNCGFLLLNKGSEFIEKWSIKCLRSSPCEFSDSLSSKDVMCKVDDAMESDLVKHAMEIGLFPSYIIRAAIFLQVKETGSSFSNIDDLCIAVSCLKEEVDKETLKREVTMNSVHPSIDPVKERDIKPSENIMDTEQKPHIKKAYFNADSDSGTTCEVTNESTLKDRCLCKICMDREVSIVFLPCGHLLACTSCAPALQCCPMCRKAIEATVRAYLN
ncbi:putative inhibitor of apoptosis [Uloborus diversus]|uniref:putative inhibitor of apoptosis n=1 Tax=Uloborus diversus TaxID=327109 RepID=UPI0024090B7A|nr:putative inhibitor of apoptosis [Uloborus diversus]XP_054708294.1 putative inhibitor of apoptosis [Uloborus diversus]XP_054708295.1 putative inhibitor of apoptosis [Uloborus diversus]XP_054708296.1 putative inhibitor of apoptosis [Uloborus diversus]XP_054708297.1 putative inhibitor of apoptosis [Uloborus diversus]